MRVFAMSEQTTDSGLFDSLSKLDEALSAEELHRKIMTEFSNVRCKLAPQHPDKSPIEIRALSWVRLLNDTLSKHGI